MTHANTMFVLGVILGALFCYSGLLSFCSGMVAGVVILKNFVEDTHQGTQSAFTTALSDVNIRKVWTYFLTEMARMANPDTGKNSIR